MFLQLFHDHPSEEKPDSLPPRQMKENRFEIHFFFKLLTLFNIINVLFFIMYIYIYRFLYLTSRKNSIQIEKEIILKK